MFKAKDIMHTDLITVKIKTPIYDAIRTLVEHNITGLPVINDDNSLAGIISEKDMLKLLYDIEDKPGRVEDFMTENIHTFEPEDSLIDLCDCFIKNQFRRVPIVENDQLVGIVSRKDLIRYILELRHKDKAEA